jgi:hypothetical protein
LTNITGKSSKNHKKFLVSGFGTKIEVAEKLRNALGPTAKLENRQIFLALQTGLGEQAFDKVFPLTKVNEQACCLL